MRLQGEIKACMALGQNMETSWSCMNNHWKCIHSKSSVCGQVYMFGRTFMSSWLATQSLKVLFLLVFCLYFCLIYFDQLYIFYDSIGTTICWNPNDDFEGMVAKHMTPCACFRFTFGVSWVYSYLDDWCSYFYIW